MIIIKYFASVREYMGKKVDHIENIDNIRISELVEKLKGENGKLSSLIMENGKFKRTYKILVNGRDLDFLDGENTIIKDGDIIAIFPPIGGG